MGLLGYVLACLISQGQYQAKWYKTNMAIRLSVVRNEEEELPGLPDDPLALLDIAVVFHQPLQVVDHNDCSSNDGEDSDEGHDDLGQRLQRPHEAHLEVPLHEGSQTSKVGKRVSERIVSSYHDSKRDDCSDTNHVTNMALGSFYLFPIPTNPLII